MTVLAVYCYFKSKKKSVRRKKEKKGQAGKEPVYDFPQVIAESSADMELKENTYHTSNE